MKKLFTICFFLTFVIGANFAQNITDSLIFYYSCNGNLIDNSGNGLNATTNGTLVPDELGNPSSAYDLDGIDNKIDIPYSPLYKVDLPATFKIKFKVDNFPTSFNTALFVNDYVEDFYYGLRVTLTVTHKISIMYGDGGDINSSSRRTKIMNETISDGAWYNLVVIWKGATDMEIYLNCQNQSGAYSGYGGNINYSSQNLNAVIGLGDSDINEPPVYFDGQVDEIAFWSRELSTDEVMEICNASPIGIPNYESSSSVPIVKNIYPNPFKFNSHVELNYIDSGDLTFSLYKTSGQLAQSMAVDSKHIIVERNGLPQGMYFFHITNSSSSILESGKLIIQ